MKPKTVYYLALVLAGLNGAWGLVFLAHGNPFGFLNLGIAGVNLYLAAVYADAVHRG